MTHLYLTLLILAGEPAAQTNRPGIEADQVFACDFEQSSDRNFDSWPDAWTRRRGRGYPAYLSVGIVAGAQPERPDNRCLRIALDGGAVQLYSPSITIVPEFSYQLTARLRAVGLEHDAVSCAISFYDGEHKLLETHESTRIREAKDWIDVKVGPVTPAGLLVRSATVTVHVRSIESSGTADLFGEIYLDDLWVGRLPKLSLEVNGENGIFTDPNAIRATCRVSGFKNASPQIKFELRDVYGKVLHESDQVMKATEDPSRSRSAGDELPESMRSEFSGSAAWQPPVSGAGFYSVRISTPGHSGLMMTAETHFVVMPPLARGKSGEFGWSLPNGDQPLPIRTLPSLLKETGIHWVKFPVWFGSQDKKRAEEIAWFAERLGSFDIQMIGLLDQPPAETRAIYGATDRMPIAAALADKAVWLPALDPVMTRLSLKVPWWQLGRDDDASFASYPNPSLKLQEVHSDLLRFGQRIHVGVPWKSIQERPSEGAMPWAFFSYTESLSFTGDELRSYLAAAPTDQSMRWIALQPLSKRAYDFETRLRDLVQRMLAAKTVGADMIFVPEPFDTDHGLMQPNGSPGELLLPWRTTSLLVGGRQYVGSIRLPHGSANHIFANEQDAVMVLWSDRPLTESAYLGENVRQFDLWGRQTRPRTTADGTSIRQEVEVGTMPTFLTGVNTQIAKWRNHFQFENSRLASVFGIEQAINYQFVNTFPQGVGGHIRFHLPAEWRSNGVDQLFKVGPGETHRSALRIQLGADVTSGPQQVQIDFDLTADRNYKFSLYETIEVGLGDVIVQLETGLDENDNLIVEQHITNNTDKFVSFKCFLTVPGRRRERQRVFNLGQGRTTNSYVLPNGRELLGKTLWFRAEEIDGVRIVNDHIVAHE